MKSKMRKKMIAFLLCMVLVICNSVSILADTPAEATTTVEKQTKQAGAVKEAGSEAEKKEIKAEDVDDTKGSPDSDSPEESKTTQKKDESGAPETKTTETKEDTTKATTETKEDSDKSDEVTTEEKKDSDKADEVTTETKEESDKTSEATTATETTEKDDTDAAGEEGNKTSEDSDKKNTEEAKDENKDDAEKTEAPTELTYENDDVKIIVSANAENAIPEGASLQVVPILKDDKETAEQYKEVVKELEAKSEKEEYAIAGFLAYDITFIDADGNEIEPNGEVKVSMEYTKETTPIELEDDKILADTKNVTVMHLEENAEGKVKEVVDMSKNDQLKDVKTTETKKIEKAEFVTDSFSVFTITWIRSDNGGETFDFSSQIHMVKQNYGNYYVDMTATVSNGNLTLETEDANPVLYTSTISSSGTNNQLYSVQENNSTYRFIGAYIATKYNQYDTYNIAEDAQKITKLTGRKSSSNQEVMMYQLTGDTSYRNLENDQYVVFVYSNDSLTTNAQCYSQNGNQLQYYSYGSGSQENVALTGIGESLDVRNDNNVIPNINNYTYRYTVVGEGDNAVEVDYLRYINDYLQYSLDGTNWSDVNSEPVKFIYSSKGGHGHDTEPGQIETADTRGLIDIDLFNYNTNVNGTWQKNYHNFWFGTGLSNQWSGDSTVTQGIVRDNLGDDGYPVLINGNINNSNRSSIDEKDYSMNYQLYGNSLSGLFNGDWASSANYGLNHLFSYDNSTGYYSYDSDENYAYYDTDSDNTEKNFIVYANKKKKGDSNDTEWQNNGGAFMPFAEWDVSDYTYGTPNQNLTNWEKMYTFGMHIGFDFTQPEDGQVNGQDMTFEFSGDDDVWVFIDGKLVLDIGGIHNAASGTINFATGEVYVNGNRQDSLKQVFTLSGNTFADNSTHRLEFFYLERGAGASNCSLRFNMPPKQSDTIEITKEITNTDRKKYANIEFSFKAYLQDEEFKDEEVYEVIPEGTPYKVKKNGVLTGEDRTVGDGNIFKLKSGETAVFEDINPDLKYYVQEIAVDSDEFDKVEIDGWEVEYIDDKGETVETDKDSGTVDSNVNYIAQSKPKVVGENAVIKFKNNCAESNMNELRITKYMAEGQEYQATDTFTLLVELENTDGDLVPYEGEYYITTGEGNNTKYYTSNFIQMDGSNSAGETEDGEIPIRVGYTVSITDIYVRNQL